MVDEVGGVMMEMRGKEDSRMAMRVSERRSNYLFCCHFTGRRRF